MHCPATVEEAQLGVTEHPPTPLPAVPTASPPCVTSVLEQLSTSWVLWETPWTSLNLPQLSGLCAPAATGPHGMGSLRGECCHWHYQIMMVFASSHCHCQIVSQSLECWRQ